MDDNLTTRTIWTPSLPALIVIGLVAVAMGFAVLAIPDAPPLIAITAGLLALAGVAAVPRRWTAPIAGVLGATLVLVGSFAQPFTAYHLSRPWTRDFAATLLLLAGGGAAGISGVVAGVHAMARRDRRTWPRPLWGVALLTGLAGMFVGATVFGTVARNAMAPADPGLAAADAEVFVAEDLSFVDAPEDVTAGRVVIELRNASDVEHDVTIAELDDRVVTVAQPDQTARGAVELTAGTYTYYCSVPGHRDAGMEGTLTVAP